MTTITQIAALAEQLTEAGFDVKIWRDQRIYLNGYGRDIKAFIRFDHPTIPAAECDDELGLWAGAGLDVRSDANQTQQWLTNRAKQVKHSIMERLVEMEVYPGPICERWQDVLL
jgi:hypothetical protein